MNIIITGAGRGIGYESALKLAEDSRNTVFALSRNAGRLEELRKTIELHCKGTLIPVVFDLENENRDEPVTVIGLNTTIDVLINNAGFLVNKPFEELSHDDWLKSFEVNLFGPVRLIRQLLPGLEGEHKSHIVNILSMGGFQGSAKFPGLAAYSSSKAALANLTELLAEEFKEKNIAVNGLALGAVQTEMLNEAFPGYKAPVKADEMADFVSWFALNGQRYFNGKLLPVALSTP